MSALPIIVKQNSPSVGLFTLPIGTKLLPSLTLLSSPFPFSSPAGASLPLPSLAAAESATAPRSRSLRDLLGQGTPRLTGAMSATASAAAALLVLVLPFLAVAAGEGVCPRAPSPGDILRQVPASCPAADSPLLRGHHLGVVEGDDVVLQKAVTLVLQNREDLVAVLFYASWCPFSKIFRTDFQKLSSFFPTIAHFSFEESRIKPRMLSRYGVRAFPTLFLVNSTVRVRYHGSRTMNSLVMFYKDVTGVSPVSLDTISLDRMEDTVNIIENDEKTEQEDSLFLFARSPDRLLHQDTCLALASSFVFLRLLYFLLPKLNACVKLAWSMRLRELNRLFPSLS